MKEYVLFKIDESYYGVDIENVENIERIMHITRVPHTADFVAGVINLRGNIAPVVDIRKRFDKDEKSFTEDSRIIILNVDNTRIGIIVDQSSEVMQLSEEEIDKAPQISQNENTMNFVDNIGKKDGRIIMLVDLRKVLDLVSEEEE